MKTHKVAVGGESDGRRLAVCLRASGISRSLIVFCKQIPGGILLNNKPVWTNEIVHTGDIITLLIPESHADGGRDDNIAPQDIPLAVVYEDEDYMVVDKPPNMPVHPSRGHVYGTLANAAAHYFASRGQPRVFRPVVRLDKDTSGLVLLAKNRLAADIDRGGITKIYAALVSGIPDPPSGEVCLPVIQPEGGDERRTVGEGGQPARTAYRVIKRLDGAAYLRLRLFTGRTHQIRVHMSAIGHPLIGDTLYGWVGGGGLTRQALHACRLRFTSPVTGRVICCKSPLPEDMRAAAGAMGCYLPSAYEAT